MASPGIRPRSFTQTQVLTGNRLKVFEFMLLPMGLELIVLDGVIVMGGRVHGPGIVILQWILYLHIRYVRDCESSIPLILSGSWTIPVRPTRITFNSGS